MRWRYSDAWRFGANVFRCPRMFAPVCIPMPETTNFTGRWAKIRATFCDKTADVNIVGASARRIIVDATPARPTPARPRFETRPL